MSNIPKTAARFEADYNSLKKDLPNFYQYVKVIILSFNPKLEYSNRGNWDIV